MARLIHWQPNEGENHLHGGLKGFDKQMFKAKIDSDDTVTFGRISPDGEEGYPGEFMFIVSYTFDDCRQFCYELHRLEQL